jgi:hypothetical protein
MSIKCIDNFLKPQVFKQIEDVFLSDHFSWFFNEYKVYGDKEYFDNFQMTHTLYKDGEPKSNILIELPKELWQNLGVDVLLTCKANLTTRVETPTITGYHNDVTIPGATTAVLYINKNNGATIFENGEEYQSLPNRCVIFPSSIKHASKSHTDIKRRVVLNINYLNEKTMLKNK